MKKKESLTVNLRPPIVTVLGHVDHGKTSLLDTIRKTNVAAKEAGGITQSIGASQVVTSEEKKITFIDTPGHATFSQMRSRGAKAADIAVLVVAADDGVKPQTKEALGYIKEAEIPFIVAFSKIDLPQANVEKVKSQLASIGVSFEGQGGDIPQVSLSSKSKKGIKELLEMIILVSEVNEIGGDKKGELQGVVIETSKDKRGPIASAVITNGTIAIGMEITAEDTNVKVRGLFDSFGKPTKEAGPGDPVQILGFSKLPPVGARITMNVSGTSDVENKVERKVSQKKEKGKIPVVIKAKSAGALRDLLANLPDHIFVVYSSVGDVVESDIFSAKSSSMIDETYPARIFAFESKISPYVSKLAEEEGVEIERFEVIYKLFEKLEELIADSKEKILGEAEIIASFPFNNIRVAGCKVTYGRIARSDNLVLMRGDKKLGESKIASMKKEKQNIDKAQTNEEFGIILATALDFKVGDMLLSVRK